MALALTASGEVAAFVDDNQFGFGQSPDKCGFEIVSLFWHSVKSGSHNPYSSAQIHAMAHTDYVHFDGPDLASNHNGMADWTLYADLEMHKFKYVKLAKDWNIIRGFIGHGYPVVIGGVSEATVFDVELNSHVPYPWIKPGVNYFHIILATGLDGPNILKFRDTANVQPNGQLRPGPRRYRTDLMHFTTATALVPTWLPAPPASWGPVTGCKGV